MVVKVRPVCVPDVALESRLPARTRHDAETVARHLRVLTVTTRIGAVVGVFFGIQGLIVGRDVLWIGMLNLVSGATRLTHNVNNLTINGTGIVDLNNHVLERAEELLIERHSKH